MEQPPLFSEATLVMPHALYLRAQARRQEGTLLLLVARAERVNGAVEWLGRALLPDRATLAAPLPGDLFFAVSQHDGSGPMPYAESQLGLYPRAVVGELFVGQGAWKGLLWGFVRDADGERSALAWLELPGLGMERITLRASDAGLGAPTAGERRRPLGFGAVGTAGRRSIARMQAARYLLAGLDRGGEFIFQWLARLGAEVALVQDTGTAAPSGGRVVAERIASARGAAAAREATVLIDCGVRESDRLAHEIYATVYHKVQLTIAPCLRINDAGERISGADVRLLLPGDRCLRCCGGITDYPRALRELAGAEARAVISFDLGREERLLSLEQVTSGLALRLLESLFAGRIAESRWLHLEFEAGGKVRLHERFPGPRTEACPLCELAGGGDAALGKAG